MDDGELFLKDVVERSLGDVVTQLRPIGATVGSSFPRIDTKKDYSRGHQHQPAPPSSLSASREPPPNHGTPHFVNSLEAFRAHVSDGDVGESASAKNEAASAVSTEALQKLESVVAMPRCASFGATVHTKDFLVALDSSVAQHRHLALRALLCVLDTASSSTTNQLQAALSSTRLLACVSRELTANQPAVVCLALTAVHRLLRRVCDEVALELYAEVGVPLADINENGDDDVTNSDQEEEEDSSDEALASRRLGRDQVSRLLTKSDVALPQKLLIAFSSIVELGRVLDTIDSHTEEGESDAEGLLAAFWECLALCITKTSVMLVVKDPAAIAALQRTLHQVLLGRLEKQQSRQNRSSNAFASCMAFLRTVFHHKQACFVLLATSSIQVDILNLSHFLVDAAQKRHISHSSVPTGNCLGADVTATQHIVEGSVSFFLALRSAARHGCNGLLRDYGPQLVQSVSCGSLVTVEMCLLSADDDIAAETHTSILDECARSAVQLLIQQAETSSSKSTGGDATFTEKLVAATALHYLSTYFAVEGARSLVLFGSALETQSIVQRLLQGSVMMDSALAAFFVRLQWNSTTERSAETESPTKADLSSPSGVSLPMRKMLAVQATVDHGRIRLVTICASAFPITRDGSAAFIEAVAARFVELCLVCRDVKSSVLPDELCAAIEVTLFLSSRQDAAQICALMALVVMHCIAVTKHCLDAAPRIAEISLRPLDQALPQDAVARLVAGLGQHDAPPAPSWAQHFMDEAPIPFSQWIIKVLGLHSKAKLVLRAPRLLVSSVLLAAKRPGLLTIEPSGGADPSPYPKPLRAPFPAAIFALLGASLACCDDGVLSPDDSSRLASGMQPILENLFGDSLASPLAAILCATAVCLVPKSSLCLLQALIDTDRDSPVAACEADCNAAWSILQQQSSWTQRWALADVLDLVQRSATWLATFNHREPTCSTHILHDIVVEMVRFSLNRTDIKSNNFTRLAVQEPLLEAGLGDVFGLGSLLS